jgi:hypothetical protein
MRVWDLRLSFIREETGDSDGVKRHTGWLLSPDQHAYLMFVPPDALLPDPPNILTIPNSTASSVDFSHAMLGPGWHYCYCS